MAVRPVQIRRLAAPVGVREIYVQSTVLAPLVAALVAGPAMLVRTSAVDLTPPELLPLGGYTERGGRPTLPGGDTLRAYTLIFEQGGQKVALVSAEMLTIPDSLRREVVERLPKSLHLFLAATHTHCAPDSQMLNDRMTFAVPGIATFKRRWLTWYATRIAKGVQAALDAKPRSTDMLAVTTWHVALNRGRRPFAEPDQTATLLSVPADQGFAPLVFSYSAHPVFYGSDEFQTRSDWPGAFEARGMAVLAGALGDASPAAPGKSPAEKIANFFSAGEAAMTNHFGRGASFMNAPAADLLWVEGERWIEQPIELGPKSPHPTFAKTYKIPDFLAQQVVKQFAPDHAFITAFRIGKLAIVGIPGEPMSELGRRVRDAGRRLGFRHVLVVSHVNGWMGYILSPQDYDRGGYEATLSFYGREEGDAVVAAAIQALQKLSGTGSSGLASGKILLLTTRVGGLVRN